VSSSPTSGAAEGSEVAPPLVLTHPASYQHLPPEHPERPERIAAIEAALDTPEFSALQRRQLDLGQGAVPGAERAVAAAGLVHDPDYVDAMFKAGARRNADGVAGWIDADTYIGPGSINAAAAGLLSAGAAIDAVLAGDAATAFSFCRPPGHHATRDRAMGFCFFNNAAAAAAAGLEAGMERVAIVDFDVHHGNGTQDIFYARGDVLYISTHQWPLYPGTGAADEHGRGEGEGCTLNLPMPAGSGDHAYLEAFDAAVLPALRAYSPELLVVSAGFDAHAGDPLAQMEVSTEGFGLLAARLLAAADQLSEGRSAWILEGGYNVEALGSAAAQCVRAALQGG